MAKTRAIAARLPLALADQIEKKAIEKGINLNQYLKRLLELNADIDPVAQATIETHASALGLSGAKVLEILAVNFGAMCAAYERAAAYKVKRPSWTNPFILADEKEMLSGGELFLFLTKRYLQAFIRDKDALDALLDELDADSDEALREAEEEQMAAYTN